jgi:hypothetical protein
MRRILASNSPELAALCFIVRNFIASAADNLAA